MYTSTALSDPEELTGWCTLMSAVTYCGLPVKDWPATSVAPAAMQFLEVAGELTVVAPWSGEAPAEPSLPAAKTAVKSCDENKP